ncbi:MAG: 30S ribosome-binding factor RbfA [candidate division Zixibacteria bacterium]|nr:30S ribosome-binding factor RbfA [candidate division Zixibacteria bacterium]
MPHRRPVRVADQIKEEISDILRTEMKDPRLGFLTITAVDISTDLRHAKVFFSVLGTDKEKEQCRTTLEKAAGFVRSQLGRRVRMRHIPELLFRYDDSYAYAQRIAEVMKKIEPESDGEAVVPSAGEER